MLLFLNLILLMLILIHTQVLCNLLLFLVDHYVSNIYKKLLLLFVYVQLAQKIHVLNNLTIFLQLILLVLIIHLFLLVQVYILFCFTIYLTIILSKLMKNQSSLKFFQKFIIFSVNLFISFLI